MFGLARQIVLQLTLGSGTGFQDKARCSFVKGTHGYLRIRVHSQVNDFNLGKHSLDQGGRLKPIHDRHCNINQNHVRLHIQGGIHKIATICDDTHRIEFWFEKSLTKFSHERMVIGDYDSGAN